MKKKNTTRSGSRKNRRMTKLAATPSISEPAAPKEHGQWAAWRFLLLLRSFDRDNSNPAFFFADRQAGLFAEMFHDGVRVLVLAEQLLRERGAPIKVPRDLLRCT